MKAIFMGTPEISAKILEALLDSDIEVIAVVTQPDKPKGRGKEMAYPEVKEVALKHNLPIYQPVKARAESFIKEIRSLNPDIIIVVAFGQILVQEFLDIPKLGCINVHASLLPKFRGAAPIQYAIIEGEQTTGVTIMKMDAGIDTGDMIYKEEVEIDPEETAGTLHDKLAAVGAHALLVALEQIKNHTAVYEKQDDSKATHVRQFKKEYGNLDFTKDAVSLERLIRGLNPWPSAYTTYDNQTMKVWKTKVLSETSDKEPGTIISVDKEGIKVSTKDNVILIKEIQMPGKKRVLVEEYIKGNSIEANKILG